MFKNMRRSDRELSQEEALVILEKCSFGVLSVLGDNEYAYGVPLNYVFFNNNVYIHCAKQGFKLDSLRKNPKVCFTVVGATETLADKFSTNYESAIVFGTAIEIIESEKIEALKAFIYKFSPDFKEEGMQYIEKASSATTVIKIEAQKITGKARR